MRHGRYNPECAESYVWQMIPKGHKPGQPAQYVLTREPSPKLWEQRGYTLINPVQIGRYDREGFYCTFRQGVEGSFKDKYFRLTQGKREIERAKNEYERKKVNERYGVVEEVAV
jgi:hypothetical protein